MDRRNADDIAEAIEDFLIGRVHRMGYGSTTDLRASDTHLKSLHSVTGTMIISGL
jgi:hypothetical protein